MRSIFYSFRKDSCRKREFYNVYRIHVYRDIVGGEGGILRETIRIFLLRGLPLGFGEFCVDFWDFQRGAPEVVFLLLIPNLRAFAALLYLSHLNPIKDTQLCTHHHHGIYHSTHCRKRHGKLGKSSGNRISGDWRKNPSLSL